MSLWVISEHRITKLFGFFHLVSGSSSQALRWFNSTLPIIRKCENQPTTACRSQIGAPWQAPCFCQAGASMSTSNFTHNVMFLFLRIPYSFQLLHMRTSSLTCHFPTLQTSPSEGWQIPLHCAAGFAQGVFFLEKVSLIFSPSPWVFSQTPRVHNLLPNLLLCSQPCPLQREPLHAQVTLNVGSAFIPWIAGLFPRHQDHTQVSPLSVTSDS